MNAPEKIYLPTRDGQSDSIWNDHWTHGKDVEFIRADIHEAEIDALKAENAELHTECDRLTNLLQWEQGRRERIGTHVDECWKWGPSHYECASREIERLTAMLGPQKVLSDESLTLPGWYWWRAGESGDWTMVQVEELGLLGQFIGPIKIPEVQG